MTTSILKPMSMMMTSMMMLLLLLLMMMIIEVSTSKWLSYIYTFKHAVVSQSLV